MELIGSDEELKYEINANTETDFSNNNNDNDSFAYIPYDILTPNEEIGMSQTEEKSIRCFLLNIIQEMGIIMRINHTTVLTAMNIANHFYLKQPFNLYEPIYILCASLFISGKMEENVKKPGDLLSAALYILTQKKSEKDKEETRHIDYSHLKIFPKMKEYIYNAELVILKELAYDLHSFRFHPHCFLLHYIKKISDDANLLKHSWGFLNDMYRTSLIANYPPNALACSAIFIASRKYYISLPKDIPWWEIFETSIQQIEEIIAETMKLYEYYSDYDLYDIKKIFKRIKFQKEREIQKKNEPKKRDNHKHHRHHKHHHKHYGSRSRSKEKRYSRHHRHRKHKSHSKNSIQRSSLSSSSLSVHSSHSSISSS